MVFIGTVLPWEREGGGSPSNISRQLVWITPPLPQGQLPPSFDAGPPEVRAC